LFTKRRSNQHFVGWLLRDHKPCSGGHIAVDNTAVLVEAPFGIVRGAGGLAVTGAQGQVRVNGDAQAVKPSAKDALEVNDSAVQVLGDAVLRQIAQELAAAIRRNVTVDWTVRESVRAQLRVLVKRILRKHGYPPDKREKAAQLVLEQAEALAGEAAEEAA
jgi:hypothetical protein